MSAASCDRLSSPSLWKESLLCGVWLVWFCVWLSFWRLACRRPRFTSGAPWEHSWDRFADSHLPRGPSACAVHRGRPGNHPATSSDGSVSVQRIFLPLWVDGLAVAMAGTSLVQPVPWVPNPGALFAPCSLGDFGIRQHLDRRSLERSALPLLAEWIVFVRMGRHPETLDAISRTKSRGFFITLPGRSFSEVWLRDFYFYCKIDKSWSHQNWGQSI